MDTQEPTWADPTETRWYLAVAGDLFYEPATGKWFEIERREHYGESRMAVWFRSLPGNLVRVGLHGQDTVLLRKRTSNV